MIVLGGGQDALGRREYPYFPALLELTRDFAGKDRAVLGICLGSQLVARAFGGDNQLGGAQEFGWRGCRSRRSGQGRSGVCGYCRSVPDLPVA